MEKRPGKKARNELNVETLKSEQQLTGCSRRRHLHRQAVGRGGAEESNLHFVLGHISEVLFQFGFLLINYFILFSVSSWCVLRISLM